MIVFLKVISFIVFILSGLAGLLFTTCGAAIGMGGLTMFGVILLVISYFSIKLYFDLRKMKPQNQTNDDDEIDSP